MKHWIIIWLFAPLFLFAQKEDRLGKNIQTKVAMIQNFFHKGEEGELAFWQPKGKVTYAIVNYTDEQIRFLRICLLLSIEKLFLFTNE